MSDEFAAKYPFSEKARDYLARENIASVSDEELTLARNRIMRSLQGFATKKEKNPRREIVAYVLGRILLGAAGNSSATLKYSAMQAREAADELKKDEEEIVLGIAREFFPSTEIAGEGASMKILDYLKFGFDLANENVSDGRMFFTKSGLISLLRRAIEIKISGISFSAKSLPPNIKKAADDLAHEMDKLPLVSKSAGNFQGKYLSLPAMQRIMQGLGEGKRYYGSMTLAIACMKDKLTKEQAEEVMIAYARNCSKSTHNFTDREALATLEWVYKHPTINFSMKTLREQGILDEKTLIETEQIMRKFGRK